MSTLKTCTSETRPDPNDAVEANRPTAGDMLFETDTKRIITFDGTEWYVYDYNITTAPIYTATIVESTGGTEALDPVGPYTGGVKVEVTATAEAGYTFDSWTITNTKTEELIALDGNCFTMPYANVTVLANYTADPYTISINQLEGGTTSSSLEQATEGTEVTLTTTPDAGKEVSSISATDIDGEITLTDNGDGTYTFTMRSSNVTVSSVYTDISYSVTIAESVNGSASASPISASTGTDVIITVSPSAGYALSSISASDDSGVVSLTDNGDGTHTFTMGSSNVTVTVAFETVTYNVTITESSQTNGTTSVNSPTGVIGDTIVVTATAGEGFSLQSITVTDSSGTVSTTDNQNGTYSFDIGSSDASVDVVYS